MVDVKDFEGFIVRRGTQYLVGLPYTDTLCLRWSTSPYDSYKMSRRTTAQKVAHRVGGEVCRFNPVTGKIRKG